MLTATSASTPSWSGHTVACAARAYDVSPATLLFRRHDPLLVEARRVAMGLLAEWGLGPCWIGKVLHRDHSTVLHHLAVLREGRSVEEQGMFREPHAFFQEGWPHWASPGRVRTDHRPPHGCSGMDARLHSPTNRIAARRCVPRGWLYGIATEMAW